MMLIRSRHGGEQYRTDEELEDTLSSVDSIDSETGHRNSLGLKTQSSITTLSRSFISGSAEASRTEARLRKPPSKGRVLDRINTAQSQEEQRSNEETTTLIDTVQPQAASVPAPHARDEQAPQQIPDTPQYPQNTAVQTSLVDLMSKTRIPNCTPQTFIFNKQGYTECDRTRFDIVVNGLWNKIRNDTFLFTKRNEIAFRLFQCQEAGQDMQPSIVCFCKPETVQNLRQVLSEKLRPRRFTGQIRYLIKKYAKKSQEEDHHPRGPPFRIYYWVGENPFLILHNRQHDIILRTRRASGDSSVWPSTMCGSTIRVPANGRAATIAGTLKVGGRFNALTVAHAFSMPEPKSQAELTPPRSASPEPYLDKTQETPITPYDCDDIVLDTAEYDFPKPEETQRPFVQDLRLAHEYQDLEVNLYGESFMARVTTSESANASTDTSDLDWALVELEDDSPALQNIFLTKSTGGSSVTLDNLASCPPDEDREVFVLVADRDPIRGTLTRQAASLSGVTRFGPFSACVITFENSSKLVEGDSGALVVDATTHVVYAYIIALSPLGDAYAVPLMDCVQQIQDILKVEEVHLPTAQDIFLAQTKVHEVVPLLAKDCSHYSVKHPASSTDVAELPPSSYRAIRGIPHEITSTWKFCRNCNGNNFKVGWWLKNQVSWHHYQLPPEMWKSLVVGDGSPLTIIIAPLQKIRACDNCNHNFQQTLADAFHIPPIWFSDWCRKAGSYFGSEDTFDENGQLDGHNMWFRFDVKQTGARSIAGNAQGRDYSWWKSNLFVRWHAATGKSTLLMLDPLDPVQEILLKTIGDILNSRGQSQSLRHLGPSASPYFIISALAEAAVVIHDIAVWGIRDLIRESEKSRETHLIFDPTRGRLHAGMRHSIHVVESLASTRECVNDILAAHKIWMDQRACEDTSFVRPSQEMTNRQTVSRLMNASTALSTLLHRAEANQRRLDNEIQLSMHELSSKTSKASQADLSAMRSLSMLGTAFLPATFIACLFSTSFFYSNPDTGDLSVSPQFYTIWAILVGLAVAYASFIYCLTFGLPRLFQDWTGIRPRHKTEYVLENLGLQDVELSYKRIQSEKHSY